MLFNSFEYLIFLPTIFIFYWFLSYNFKKQNLLLLVSSYIFYAWWDWRFLSLIILSSAIDYVIGIKTHEATSKKKAKNWLYISLLSNLGLLAIFKYYNFFAESFSDFMQTFGWEPNNMTLNIILPVGISFYTFQTLSYTIDIYRKSLMPTTDVLSFFTYIAFFPQLVAGPIERASNLLPQIESKRFFKKNYFNEGIVQIFIGLFRKIVIADTLGIYVDSIFNSIEIHNSSSIVLATIFYAFQIYYDFSGYSDIAIGTAKLLGFSFKQNFNLPYFSTSLTEFWRRWHMSLSFWLRDYLYISLGGNRKGIIITYRNLLLTMLIGGLWHGSSWNFVIWGGIHGLILGVEKFVKSKNYFIKLRQFKMIGFLLTFATVLFAWVFFRLPDLDSAVLAITKVFSSDYSAPFIGDISIMANSLTVLSLGLLFDFYLYYENIHLENLAANFSIIKLVGLITLLVVLIALFYSTSNNFIYFQF